MSQKQKKRSRINGERDYLFVSSLEARSLEEAEERGMVLEGKFASFNDKTLLFEFGDKKYYEVILPTAFDNTRIDRCFLRYNHSSGNVALARVNNRQQKGNMKIEKREDGMYWRAELIDTTFARDLYEAVKSGVVDKASFSFTIKDEDYEPETRTWTIKEVGELFDVSPVDIPAYENTETTVAMRSRRYLDAEAQVARAEALRVAKRKVKLKIMLGGSLSGSFKEN